MKEKALLLFALLCMTAQGMGAQERGTFAGRPSCTPYLHEAAMSRGEAPRRSVYNPIQTWDATRTYRQLVVLVEFADASFSCENPRERYDRLFNETGYSERYSPGCVADYFRDQSGGLCNLQFDVVGPYRVDEQACPDKTQSNHGSKAAAKALQLLLADQPDRDYSVYDWNGDKDVEQVVFVFASFSGVQISWDTGGYLWPNSGYLVPVAKTADGLWMNFYSASAELWGNNVSCGIGTIIHEFCHCLGLPDIYPTSNYAETFSVCDEWDVMDGGNYTNWGWCPPNLTAQEKMYLGWLTPTELNGPTTVSGLKPVADGGEAYIVRHTDNEYLLLENRQRTRWDKGIPGQGLVITHVDFNDKSWCYNEVNIIGNHFRYDIVHADNLTYNDWKQIIKDHGYMDWRVNEERMYSRLLSSSPYPWSTDSTTFVNDALTDTSVPAAKMFNKNADGSTLLGKAITDIRMADDGTVSFNFMTDASAIGDAVRLNDKETMTDDHWYTLDGRRLSGQPTATGLYIHNKKVVRRL